jgi:membrane-associated phospholipid phosphatase
MWGVWGDPGKYIGNPLILAGIGGSLFAASRRSGDRTFRSLSYSLVQGTIMSALITQSSKTGFRRLRPNGEDHGSFPSGHAADSFLFATVFAEHYGWKAAIPGYAIAAYVAASRLEERKHHLTDVAAGSAIGYLLGRTVSRRMRTGRPRVTWQVYPSRGGFAGGVRVALP